MKRIVAFAVLTALCMAACIPALAHSGSLTNTFDKTTRDGTTYIGNETMGWLLNENAHTNSQTITYKTSAGMSNATRQKVDNGAKKWDDLEDFSAGYESSSSNMVMISCMVSSGYNVELYMYTTNSSGHFTSWTIAINSQYESNLTEALMAHEFGHVYGLGDLTTYANRHKLMYKICEHAISQYATGPTSADIWGARVITGDHSSHSWEYVYVSNNKHRRRCTSCGGYKTQGCTPNASGYCTKCGHYVTNSGNGVSDPTAALLPNADEERRFMIGMLI